MLQLFEEVTSEDCCIHSEATKKFSLYIWFAFVYKNLSVEEVVEQCKVTQAMASMQLGQYEKEGW